MCCCSSVLCDAAFVFSFFSWLPPPPRPHPPLFSGMPRRKMCPGLLTVKAFRLQPCHPPCRTPSEGKRREYSCWFIRTSPPGGSSRRACGRCGVVASKRRVQISHAAGRVMICRRLSHISWSTVDYHTYHDRPQIITQIMI